MSDASYVLGIDLGGTKIAAAVFDQEHRRISDVHALPTMAGQPAKLTLMNLKRAISQATRSAGVEGPPAAVGMGSPGPFDTEKGRLAADTLPNLRGFPIGSFVAEELGAPLYLENDANCFALAEALVGEGKGHETVLGLTIGTGFGCGLVVGGRIYRGSSGNAGEVSHCRVAGGSFDDMISGGGVRRFYERVTGSAEDSLSALDRGPGIRDETPSPKRIGELADAGDPEAVETWELFGRAFGEALGTIVAIVDPSICVVGGSVARRFSLFQPALELTIQEFIAPEAAATLIIKPSQLDHTAGVAGAAEYAFQRIAEESTDESAV